MPSPRDFLNSLTPEYRLPFTLLTSYLFFLTRRPVSDSNRHFLERRLSGLKSLASVLQESNRPELIEAVKELWALTPANFSQRVRALQLQLLDLSKIPLEIPTDCVRSALSPGPDFLANVQRVLLILGPAIGIGDEIICFSIPACLKQWRPNLRVDLLTGYEGLWDNVKDVDSRQYYRDHRQLLNAIRGCTDSHDMVLLADFEKPRLGVAMCQEKVQKYVEFSIGANSAMAVDNVRRWTYLMPVAEEAVPNYYLGLRRMMRWLGGPGRPAAGEYGELVRRQHRPAASLRIFASPFTSKSNPSPSYWCHILSGLVSAQERRQPVEIVLDAGPNERTERFASLLALSLGIRCPSSVPVRVARSNNQKTLSLQDAFRELERSSVVICADSYCAHAAPLFDAMTIVLANPGVERWRVPSMHSFYFDIRQPLDESVPAIGHLMDLKWPRPEQRREAQYTVDEALHLCQCTQRLRASIAGGYDAPAICREAYESFLTAYSDFFRHFNQSASDVAGLTGDVDYLRSWRSPEDAPQDGFRKDFLDHLDQELWAWENSNLAKLLALMVARRAEAAECG